MPHLTIGKLAERTGVSTDTLRYYEKLELLKAGARTIAGYRLYHYDAVRIVRFIRGAQSLQFSLADIRGLLSLSDSDAKACRQVLKRTEDKIREAETAIMDLQEIKKTVGALVEKRDDAPRSGRSVMDMLRRHTRLLGIAAAALLSCLCDTAIADDDVLPEDDYVKIEQTFKRGKTVAAS